MSDDDPEIPPLTLRILIDPRNWRSEATYWAYSHGLRGYCWQHDVNHWGWTHRRCGCARFGGGR